MSFRIARPSSRILSSTRRLTALNAQLQTKSPLFSRAMASHSLPDTMEGVVINKNGGTEVLEIKTDLSVPQPKENEVLIKNEYVGVNFIDTYLRSGLYPPPPFPYILGRESSGTILSTGSGNVYSLKVGDRVVVLAQRTYAQYTAAPSVYCRKIPDAISTKDAAAALLQGMTALTLIRESYRVQKGDWILVHAAAGGTGLWLVQLLKAVGAHVIGTCSTSKIDLVTSHGVDVVIDYTKEDVVKKVKDVTNGNGCQAVYDGVGKATFDISMECVARKGTLASFGNASGAVPPVTISRLSAKNVKLLRPMLFSYITTREEFEQYAGELFEFMIKNKIDVRVHEVYPLKDVARAHEDLEGRKTTGKLLLKP